MDCKPFVTCHALLPTFDLRSGLSRTTAMSTLLSGTMIQIRNMLAFHVSTFDLTATVGRLIRLT